MITYIAAKKISDFMGHNHIEIQGLSDQDFNMTIKYAKDNVVIIPWNKDLTGNKLSEETKEKMRKANTGKTLSDEHRQKIGIANAISKKGMTPWNKGKKLSDDQKRRYEFIITCPNGLKYTVNNMTNYCKEHGLILSKMSSVSTGKLKHHRGYTVERIK